jgi:hypothetical protein
MDILAGTCDEAGIQHSGNLFIGSEAECRTDRVVRIEGPAFGSSKPKFDRCAVFASCLASGIPDYQSAAASFVYDAR